ncbi:MAG: hypothetical protein ABIR57_03440, partial [Aeromicrobium sp.]
MTVLLALFLTAALPGIAGGVFLSWFSPDPKRTGALLTRALSCGVAIWLISSGLLERTVGVTSTSSWVTAGFLALVSLSVLSLPRSRVVLRQALPEVGYLSAMLGVAVVSWLPIGALVVRTQWSPLGSTPWYYWGLADQIARAGEIPAKTTEWGTKVAFLDDYHLFSTATAMLFTQGGPEAIRALQAVTILAVVLLACGAALLANVFGAGRLASLAAIPVVIASGIGPLRITSYRPEAFALGLVLLLVTLCVDWFMHRERGSLVAGCLLIAALSQVHGIALVTAVVLVVASALALCPRRGALVFLRRCVLSGLVLGGSAVFLGLVLGGASGTVHAGKLGDTSGLADPTWEFMRAIRGYPSSLPPDNREMVKGSITSIYQGTGWWVAGAVALAGILLVASARRRPKSRQMVVFVLVAIVGLAVPAAILALGWSSYVPRRTGAQRLVQEATLLLGPLIACGLASIQFSSSRIRLRRLVSLGVVVVLCGAGAASSARLEKVVEHQRPTQGDERALANVKIPSDSVVLSNSYTEGYIRQVTGA